jgi:hypothetical protein
MPDDDDFLHRPINESLGERSLAEYLDLYLSYRVIVVFVSVVALMLVLLFTDFGKVDPAEREAFPTPTVEIVEP